MKRPYTAAPGVSLPSISLFNATPIKGVIVDNPSGGWLYIAELRDFVPPYTLAWGRDLEYSGSAISVTYGQSPASQVSTRQGDPYTVTLYDEPVGASNGVPTQFIDQFNPILTSFVGMTKIPGDAPSVVTFTSNVTGGTKRIRVHAVYLNVGRNGDVLRTLFTEFMGHFTSTTSPDTRLRIAGNKLHDERTYVPYFDLPVGEEFTLSIANPTAAFLDATFYPGMASVDVGMDILYELI